MHGWDIIIHTCLNIIGSLIKPRLFIHWRTNLKNTTHTQKYNSFHTGKMIWYSLKKLRPFCLGFDKLNKMLYYAVDRMMAWWRHQRETFSAILALCAANSPVIGEFPSQRPVTRRFDVFFDLCLNKRFSKQKRRRWFETPLGPLWRHCNGCLMDELQKDSQIFNKF